MTEQPRDYYYQATKVETTPIFRTSVQLGE
jgi:hypothetical protein